MASLGSVQEVCHVEFGWNEVENGTKVCQESWNWNKTALTIKYKVKYTKKLIKRDGNGWQMEHQEQNGLESLN